MSLFMEYFWVRKFLLLLRGASIVRRWGDVAIGGFKDTPRFRVIPLGPTKLPSSRFLRFVGYQTSKKGFLLSFKGLVSFIA